MRLLNVNTLAFEEFFEHDIPPYAIISHRWERDETTYKDFRKGRNTDTPGYQKVLKCCEMVRSAKIHHPVDNCWNPEAPEGSLKVVEWMWMDTCCIDKRSSAELSEAINSMYAWMWKEATSELTLVVAYLSDVHPTPEGVRAYTLAFSRSAWFTRGWTLQELLAPMTVVFLNAAWEVIGHKCGLPFGYTPCSHEIEYGATYGANLNSQISGITGIQETNLRDNSDASGIGRHTDSIARRMSWAAARRTTRPEDMAYCLLGLLGINMPLLYGEGHKAFFRLQEELVKRSNDQSIFAWTAPGPAFLAKSVFAPDPSYFAHSEQVAPNTISRTRAYTVTNNGLEMRVRAQRPTYGGRMLMFELNCGQLEADSEDFRYSSVELAVQLTDNDFVPGQDAYHCRRIRCNDLGQSLSTTCPPNARSNVGEVLLYIEL